MEKIKVILGLDCTDLLRKYSFWIALLFAAYAFDTFSTIYLMTLKGIEFEIHPLVRYSALTWGPITGTILSAFLYKSIVTIGLALYLKRFSVWVLTAPIIPAIAAGIYNLSS